MRNVQDFVEKIARSTATRPLPAAFSRTTCLCTTPSRPGSDALERIVQSACAVAATARKKRAHLKRMSHMGACARCCSQNCKSCPQLGFTVFVEQRLKARIAARQIPNRIYLQTLHGDSAWPAQQSVKDFNRAIIIAKDCVNFGHASGDFRAAKGVFALRNQFCCAFRFT